MKYISLVILFFHLRIHAAPAPAAAHRWYLGTVAVTIESRSPSVRPEGHYATISALEARGLERDAQALLRQTLPDAAFSTTRIRRLEVQVNPMTDFKIERRLRADVDVVMLARLDPAMLLDLPFGRLDWSKFQPVRVIDARLVGPFGPVISHASVEDASFLTAEGRDQMWGAHAAVRAKFAFAVQKFEAGNPRSTFTLELVLVGQNAESMKYLVHDADLRRILFLPERACAEELQ